MSEEEINIAIAEACGYYYMDSVWHLPNGAHADKFPDYCNDLNAMHEAEEIFTVKAVEEDWERWDKYRRNLEHMVGPQDTFHANARQRAEAFLRTIAAWKEARND